VQRIAFELEHGRHFERMNHLQLLNHPAVYDQLRTWLAIPPVAPVPIRPEKEDEEEQVRWTRRRKQAAAAAVAGAAVLAAGLAGRGGRIR
jgi:ferric-dicitrate binding protein FerR (iron transport regulator)